MAHTLSHIGSNDVLYTTSEGGATAYTQPLQIDEWIEDAVMGNRSLAEQTSNPKLYKTESHIYKTLDKSGYEVDDSTAYNMPMYLEGWQTSLGVTITPQRLTQQFISTFFTGTNLNLYGKWKTTRLIRVIVAIPNNSLDVSLGFNVTLQSSISYSISDTYKLIDSFKSIRDTSSNIEFTNGTIDVVEFGEGDGCVNSDTVTYYGVKDGDDVAMELTYRANFTNDYVPKYTMNGNIPQYECRIAPYLVRRETNMENNWYPMGLDYNDKNKIWVSDDTQYGLLTNVNGDRTIIVSLVPKPNVTVTVTPPDSGIVIGGGRYMPGHNCTLSASASAGRTTFSHFEINGRGTAPGVTQISFIVTQDIEVLAVFLTSNDGRV